jgi:hypothetical protein
MGNGERFAQNEEAFFSETDGVSFDDDALGKPAL